MVSTPSPKFHRMLCVSRTPGSTKLPENVTTSPSSAQIAAAERAAGAAGAGPPNGGVDSALAVVGNGVWRAPIITEASFAAPAMDTGPCAGVIPAADEIVAGDWKPNGEGVSDASPTG